jgi:hypothetical protein
LAPVVNGLMKKYTDRATFVRVNIHDPTSFDLQTQLGFSATPEFYLIDPQGRIERHWDDSLDLAELEKTIQALSPAS